jgi:hypothetical protein
VAEYYKTGKTFTALDYSAETPGPSTLIGLTCSLCFASRSSLCLCVLSVAWAVWGAQEGGFNPEMKRFKRKTKNTMPLFPLESHYEAQAAAANAGCCKTDSKEASSSAAAGCCSTASDSKTDTKPASTGDCACRQPAAAPSAATASVAPAAAPAAAAVASSASPSAAATPAATS